MKYEGMILVYSYSMYIGDNITDHPPDCLHRLLLLVCWILDKALWVLEHKRDRHNFVSFYSHF